MGQGSIGGISIGDFAGNIYGNSISESVTSSDSLVVAAVFNVTIFPFSGYMLNEDGSFMLDEDGNKMLVEADTIVALDSVAAAVTFSAAQTETLSSSDGVASGFQYTATVTETITASDSIDVSVIFGEPITENISASDIVSATLLRVDVILSGTVALEVYISGNIE